MLVKVIADLLGDQVRATDGPFGVVEDVYFDRDCWQLCYLLIASRESRSLVSVAGLEDAAPSRGRLSVAVSRAQLAAGAGAWPMNGAVRWLDDMRACSVREALGWPLVGDDAPAGELSDMLVDQRTWAVDYLVANVANGFGRRQVILPLDWVRPLDPSEPAVRVRATRAQIAAAPAFGPSLLRARGRG